jgi:hypothetical protein
MIAIEETTTVQTNGSLVVRHPELKAGEQVKVIVLLDNDHPSHSAPTPVAGPKLKQDWAGGLSDLAGEFTSVQLQHKASEWRGT